MRALALLAPLTLAGLAGCSEFKPVDYRNCDHLGWDLEPTQLELECRCNEHAALCRGLEDVEALSGGAGIGVGPRVVDLGPNAYWMHGEVWEDRGEIIAAVTWGTLSLSESAGIWAFDWERNARRIVSGGGHDAVQGAYTVGEGPLLTKIRTAWRGPDDMIYTYDRYLGVVRVNPDSGLREVVWDRDTGPFCLDPTQEEESPLAIDVNTGFAVGPKGEFYLSANDSSGWGDLGHTVVRIAADGGSCELLSSSGSGYQLGTGPNFSFPVQELQYVNGTLYAMTASQLLSLDLETGDRVELEYDFLPGQLQWDETNQLLWLSGIKETYGVGIYQYEPATDFTHVMADCLMLPAPHPIALTCPVKPMWGNFNDGGGWLLPDGRFMQAQGQSIKVLEPLTGNNHIYSF